MSEINETREVGTFSYRKPREEPAPKKDRSTTPQTSDRESGDKKHGRTD